MTVVVYKSTDTSAPTLNGTAGSLITVLDAILVNGYGSQAAAGWAKEFSGTNKAAYRAATGNRMRLRVDDTGTQEARCIGYETMSDVDTGTGLFPTTVQLSGGMFMRKSNSADSTARPWICYASTTVFYFFSFAAQTVIGSTASTDGQIFFGDFDSYLSGDVFNTMICGGSATGSVSSMGAQAASVTSGSTAVSGTTGLYAARAFTQIGTAIKLGRKSRSMFEANDVTLSRGSSLNGSIYPDPIVGGLLMSPIDLWEETSAGPVNNFSRRGKLKGMWGHHHAQIPGAHLDTFSGTGSLTGRTFQMVTAYSGGATGRLILETSNNW